jgi:NADH:ubiquinone oxidoreductase subunit 6 (subunit J)
MDPLHAIGFYVSSGVSLGGALGVALLPGRGLRGASMAVVGVGLAGIYLSLSAGFAAGIALVCYAGCAILVASPLYRVLEGVVSPMWRQVGAIGAAALLAVLAYSAFRGGFVHANFYGGTFGVANLGRLFFAHDAMPTEALAVLVLVAFAGATAVWRVRERTR